MTKATLSICVIFGNESVHIERFIKSFSPVVDEFVFVRAIGSRSPDDTWDKIQAACEEIGIPCILDEYKNQDEITQKWPHVDRFDKARQLSYDLATMDLRMWADCDDVLPESTAGIIHHLKENWQYDIIVGKYSLPTADQEFERERIVGRIPCRWVCPVHECLTSSATIDPDRIKRCPELVIEHRPLEKPMISVDRNLKILEHAVSHLDADDWEPHLWFYICRDNWIHPEAHENRGIERSIEAGLKALTFPTLGIVEKYEVALMLCEACAQHPAKAIGILEPETNEEGASSRLMKHREKWLFNALRLDPSRREAVAALSMMEHDRKAYVRALAYAFMMRGIPEPVIRPWTHQRAFYAWKGALILILGFRRTGNESKAREIEEHVFGTAGRYISVLHATRRADEATKAMYFWLSTATNAGAIEWIFAVDEDDKETQEKLFGYRMVIVPKNEVGGPVAAWNEAAKHSTGRVLIQMSDDWIPTSHWDAGIINRIGTQIDEEAVLQISDGHRQDNLMCMAILTRKYYDRYGYIFWREYFSMYSDNEFSLQVKRDDVVIDGRDLVFQHFHPIFHPEKKMDAVYSRSNAPEKYDQGRRILEARMPLLTNPRFESVK